MNSNGDIRKFLFSLSEAFPGQVRPATLDIYLMALEPRLKTKNLNKILMHFIETSRFFPTCKDIVELVDPPEEDPKDKATEFVELMIGALHSKGDINALVGQENYSFWKKNTGIDRFAISQGSIDLRFQRGSLIDKFERIFRGENIAALEPRKSNLTIVSDINPEGA